MMVPMTTVDPKRDTPRQLTVAETISVTVQQLAARQRPRRTIEQVADGAGFARSTFYKRMRGATEWTASDVDKLAKFFQVSPGFLVTGYPNTEATTNSFIPCKRSKRGVDKPRSTVIDLREGTSRKSTGRPPNRTSKKESHRRPISPAFPLGFRLSRAS